MDLRTFKAKRKALIKNDQRPSGIMLDCDIFIGEIGDAVGLLDMETNDESALELVKDFNIFKACVASYFDPVDYTPTQEGEVILCEAIHYLLDDHLNNVMDSNRKPSIINAIELCRKNPAILDELLRVPHNWAQGLP
jgi:hypothetical protein